MKRNRLSFDIFGFMLSLSDFDPSSSTYNNIRGPAEYENNKGQYLRPLQPYQYVPLKKTSPKNEKRKTDAPKDTPL